MYRNRKSLPAGKQGFTLIELLVVIAVIGILASVVMASLNSARGKGRDARRRADLNQIRVAMELYLDDHGGAYPGIQGYFTNRDHPSGNNSINALQPNYMTSVPDDPQHVFQTQPTYLHMTKDYTNTTVNTANCPSLVLQPSSKFAIYAKLEYPSLADIATMTQGDSYDQCVYQRISGYNYKVGN